MPIFSRINAYFEFLSKTACTAGKKTTKLPLFISIQNSVQK